MLCIIFIWTIFLAVPCVGFLPNFWSRVLTLSWDSQTHQYITERAILNITMETLRDIKNQDHMEEQSRLGRGFWRAVGEVVKSNAAMDFMSSTRSDPVFHFDSEQWEGAMGALRQMWTQTLLSLKAREYQQARHSLGQLFHSLQDFYSHSNWVELGHWDIYLHLLHPEEPAVPVAKLDTPTCLECFSLTCRDNLLSHLTRAHRDSLLTTGYFSNTPLKPEGKCSHGGVMDSSRSLGARGGINKDSTSPLFSPHHYLHTEAARVATEATLAVLRDLRDTVGPKLFLNLLSVDQASALVFVLDTTGSMFEELTAARLRAHAIIAQRAHNSQQPGTFILVPFHDPEVGPVSETDDPQEFMQYMENLLALGGGDEPEMCLTALQLALTHSPPLSEIFVFTDASPKDAHLFDTVKALVLEKQSKVTFLLTEDPHYTTESRGKRRKRRRRGTKSVQNLDRFSLYSSLSSLSGGMTIFTSNADIHRVSAIVEDNTATDKVTLLHAESNGEQWAAHSFLVDESLKNITLHVTGLLSECLLTSPSGQRQSLLNEQEPLAVTEHFEGLYRIVLLPPVQPGQWELQAKSEEHITFNVIGGSSVNFLYYFATVTNETHPGLARMEGSPIAGAPVFLVLAVTGLAVNAEISFSHVTFLGADGESVQEVALNSSSPASTFSVEELVGWVHAVPREPFCVRLTGQDRSGAKVERVSSEMVQPTHVQIQVSSAPHLVPGHSTMVTFDLLNHGPARLFSLTADDDYGYLQNRGPHRFHVGEQGRFRGQVDLLAPPSARPGATVTLSLSVRDMSSADSNYAVVYLSVVPPDPDTAPPTCSITRIQSYCNTSICSESKWSGSLAISDRGRSGLAFIQLHNGEGIVTLHHRPPLSEENPKMHQIHHNRHRTKLQIGDPPFNVSNWVSGPSQPLWVGYTSSCCSHWAEILIWDGAGNMKRCRVTSGQQGAQRDNSIELSGAKRTSTSCVVILGGLLSCVLVK
ncbi:LOW QUALITY PROTEIN: von Willebrand factor A domain-containing protein 7 [Boleophthalmus pectinirostris]|uniref:LOW QUALITY PROTEIN: von Willebrand factor A domain-containing protein 7 n=1 Tax=Boleophthalmus pectinirostris TaxID=150288 RepID=UPI00243232EA|nr:LOW QUALITY PROTEIN: von Willebrand factor A domain-containing protein 7 [Boleophthalmus pectinirostris]